MKPPARLYLIVFAAILLQVTGGEARTRSDGPARLFDRIDPAWYPSGILYDRVVGIGEAARYNGAADAPALDLGRFRQIYFEMRGAATKPLGWPAVETLNRAGHDAAAEGVIPIAVMDVPYHRLRESALADGSLQITGDHLTIGVRSPFVRDRLFAACALRASTARGERAVFVVDSRYYFSRGRVPDKVEVDFGDGYRRVHVDEPVAVSFDGTGQHQIRLRVETDDGTRNASFTFGVTQLAAPLPNDTIQVTASIPYNGEFGTGEAYVYLAPSHTGITNPVVVVEGFDLDNSMNWDELYLLLNDENLLEDLRAQGFDAVVLNFTDATDYVQKNAFVVVELLEQVQAAIWPHATIGLAGASMGGLCGRYALAYMETNAIPHRVRTFIALDSPQLGANIPLGIQYWLDFFSGLSTDAADLLASLDSPAAREMLVYHHTDPPGSTGEPDPLRAGLLADLAAVGDYPTQPRMVAVANGSGDQTSQGFNAGDQVIDYEYSGVFVSIVGNVWAVPDAVGGTIFDGAIQILLPVDQQTVFVSGSEPYDNAPGGSRASMRQMDETTAPYGDIIALYDEHCFVPSVSALHLGVADLFHDIASEPDPSALSPFDVVYFPTGANQAHVDITPENKAWLISEIELGVTGIEPGMPPRLQPIVLHQNRPNPFNPVTRIQVDLPYASDMDVTVHDVTGALVRHLASGYVGSGALVLTWDGTDDRGARVSSGVYFCRLQTPGQVHTRKMVLVE